MNRFALTFALLVLLGGVSNTVAKEAAPPPDKAIFDTDDRTMKDCLESGGRRAE